MSLSALDNLVRIGQLKAEPRNDREVARMLTMALARLPQRKPLHRLSVPHAHPGLARQPLARVRHRASKAQPGGVRGLP